MFARWLYTIVFYLLTPLIVLRLALRARKAPAYAKRWGERFGFVRPTSSPVIWVHSVSVGETLAAVPLIKALQCRYPDATLAVTTMTPTGSERVTSIFGDSVYHCYAPYDLPDVVQRFLRRVRPSVLIIMETELWPNTIHACAKRGIPVVLANARLSQKSAEGYRKARWLAVPMMQELAAIAAQTKADSERFLSLGVAPEKISVTGNIKFDLELTDELRAQADELRQHWQAGKKRPIWLAASTHAGEDELILAAFAALRRKLPEVLLVLVPRHPERFDGVAELCGSAGFSVSRRSILLHENQSEAVPIAPMTLPVATDILLGDTMGELLVFCGASDVVFVGGSLVAVGGHNVIEPAAWGKPVLSGPYVFNFTEATQLLLDAGGMLICEDVDALAEAATDLLTANNVADNTDNNQCQAMGQAALAVTESNRGALAHLQNIIASLVPR
ncbi:MAG: lipid IV(A) 3-deoxy-D-manno-octulosonic acid transferase [Porticoccaceae bacterium]